MLNPEASVIKDFVDYLEREHKNRLITTFSSDEPKKCFELDSYHIESFLNSRQGVEFSDILIVRKSTRNLFDK